MAMTVGTGPWQVQIIESEAGWGQRVDEIQRFETKEQADIYVKNFNSHNTADSAPSWYMYATSPAYVR